jgi:hypothetical protein
MQITYFTAPFMGGAKILHFFSYGGKFFTLTDEEYNKIKPVDFIKLIK